MPQSNELMLYGPVGVIDWFDDAGFTAEMVVKALAEADGDITVRLNSGGGIATEGAAIYNALKRHEGKVTVTIDGVAASAASLIAMAGDEIVMPEGSLMMIHEPGGVTIGPADAHRKMAGALDIMAGVYAEVYAKRTGQKPDDIRAIMKAETWLGPAEALEKGFATASAGEPVEADASFDYSTYQNAPARLVALANARQAKSLPMVAVLSAPLVQPQKGPTMASTAPVPADTPAVIIPIPPADIPPVAPAASASPLPSMGGDAASMSASIAQIMKLGKSVGLDLDAIENVVTMSLGDTAKANALMIDAVAARSERGQVASHASPGIVTADGRDRFKAGVEKALMAKAGMEGGERNEFSGLTLRELARMSLDRVGAKYPLTDPMQMVGASLGMRPFMAAGYHSTSDFVEILGNTANRSLMNGYAEADETFPRWTSQGSLADFRPSRRVDLNLFPALTVVPEGAEYTYGTIGDRGEEIQLATYGKKFSITRQAIINDDIGAFTRIPQRMGRAASRTIGNLVYAILTGNPLMSDGIALFDNTDHANTTTGVLTTANLDAARAKMAVQTDPDGHVTALGIRPQYLIVPVALGGKARQLVTSEFEVSASGVNATVPNYVQNLVTVIDEARLDADSTAEWYLAANPATVDTIEVAYLNGVSTPTLEQQEGWNVDGVEYKVRIDAGVKALDFRGLLYSTGAP